MFVQQRLAALNRRAELQVVSPTPDFPLVSQLRGSPGPATEPWQGLSVHRPRFFCFPGVFKSLDGRLYANGLRNWLRRFLRQWRPDVLDAHFVWPDGVGVSLLAREFGIPYVITLRGKIYPCLEIPSQRKQCADALRNAAAVISVDQRMAAIACDLGAPANHVHVIPNGVDTKLFQPGDQRLARKELGLPKESRLIVTVAHLGERKGHHETIRALAKLPADVFLVLVGGDSPNGHDARVLRRLADSLGVGHRLILSGRRPYEQIPQFFAAADLSVLASWREGCPNVVLESLASGRPVVATRVGCTHSMIQPGVNGQLISPKNVDELAVGIRALLDNTPSANTVRNSPAVRSWDEIAEDVSRVLHAAIGRCVMASAAQC